MEMQEQYKKQLEERETKQTAEVPGPPPGPSMASPGLTSSPIDLYGYPPIGSLPSGQVSNLRSVIADLEDQLQRQKAMVWPMETAMRCNAPQTNVPRLPI